MENQDAAEWQAPPPPEMISVEKKEEPEMSEAATLGNIFIEPGRVFDDLRKSPRFIMATIIMALMFTAFSFGLYYQVGEKNFRQFYTDQINKSPQSDSMNSDAKEGMVDMYMTIGTAVRFAMPVIVVLIFAFGGFVYWVAGKAFGGTGNYLHALSTWVYASFPVAVVAMIANFIVLAFKSVDDIDIANSMGGVVQANLGYFVDAKASPMLGAVLGYFDVFLIWGWILAVIGLQRTMKISSGSAWAITIFLALIGLIFKLIGAFFA